MALRMQVLYFDLQSFLHPVLSNVLHAIITCRVKLLNADWLRQRAFFLNQEGTFGSQEGMIT